MLPRRLLPSMPPKPIPGPAARAHAVPRAFHRARLAELGAGRDSRERAWLISCARGRAALRVGHVGGQFVEEAAPLLRGELRERLGMRLLDGFGRRRAQEVAVPGDRLLVVR